MKLIDVYSYPDSVKVLWELLQERTPEQSISHREMPTWERHCLFIESHPYIAWYLILDKDVVSAISFLTDTRENLCATEIRERWDEIKTGIVGTVYLTVHDEIGIFIFNDYKGKGYASEGIRLLMEKHPRDRYLANINPLNEASINLFKKLGFTHIQNTYEL